MPLGIVGGKVIVRGELIRDGVGSFGGQPAGNGIRAFLLTRRHAASGAAWRRRSFSWSFHHALRRMTGPHQLDGAPDLSCMDGTARYPLDGWEAIQNRTLRSILALLLGSSGQA